MPNKKIKIHFSEEDLDELRSGETFDWTFTTDTGEDIDVHLYQGYDDEGGRNCTKCGNPLKMYWCKNCEDNQEMAGACGCCGKMVVEDKEYHDNCNLYEYPRTSRAFSS